MNDLNMIKLSSFQCCDTKNWFVIDEKAPQTRKIIIIRKKGKKDKNLENAPGTGEFDKKRY